MLLGVGIAARLALMWYLAKTFEDELLDVLGFLQRYQWWALGFSVAAVVRDQLPQLPPRLPAPDRLPAMAEITFRGNPINTVGELPAVGSPAPAFTLTGLDLSDVSLGDFAGQNVVLNIFPSVDTAVCATSVRTFNEQAAALEGDDGAQRLRRPAVRPGPLLRRRGDRQGAVRVGVPQRLRRHVRGHDRRGPAGRADVARRGRRRWRRRGRYTEQVPEIAQEPDYDAALAALE